jgi:hypothetical protein
MRDHARFLKAPPEFEQSRNERKKVEMRFAHLKVNHRFECMRPRGLAGARDELHLAAIGQNLKTLASYVWLPPPDMQAAARVAKACCRKAIRWGGLSEELEGTGKWGSDRRRYDLANYRFTLSRFTGVKSMRMLSWTRRKPYKKS